MSKSRPPQQERTEWWHCWNAWGVLSHWTNDSQALCVLTKGSLENFQELKPNQSNSVAKNWGYNQCWFASSTGFCVPSHWTILLHAKPLCGQPCRGQLLSVFSQWNQTKSNQSGPKYQEARTWVLFKDPWAAWVAWVARIIYIVCEITVQHGWTTWIAWNVSKTS